MYPTLKEGVSIGTFHYEGSTAVHYYIENERGEEFEISQRLCDALLKADGTKPLDLPDQGKSILPELKNHGLIRTSRLVWGEGVICRFILLAFGSSAQKHINAFRFINSILPWVSLIVFSIGLVSHISFGVETGSYFCWWIYYLMLVFSLALHETGHLISGLAFGYKMYDAGILLFGILPIGAYVSHQDKKDATKAERIQFALAGIEMNLIMAGTCLLLTKLCSHLSFTMIMVANLNVVLAGINLLPTSGLDGESALSAVYGVSSISKTAKRIILNKKNRQKLLHHGVGGYVHFCVFAMTMLCKVFLWAFIGIDVVTLFLSLI